MFFRLGGITYVNYHKWNGSANYQWTDAVSDEERKVDLVANFAHGVRMCLHIPGDSSALEEESETEACAEDSHVCSNKRDGGEMVVADCMAIKNCEAVRS